MQLFVSLLLSVVLLTACADKQIVYRTQEVKVPIKCDVVPPKKPQYDGSFDSAKRVTSYYLIIEQLLYQCVGE